METKNEETPLKIRSVKGTITAGYRLYMGNFRRIFRATWPAALLCGLVSALYYHTMMSTLPQLFSAQAQIAQGNVSGALTAYAVQSGLSLLNLVAALLFVSYAFSMLCRHREEGIIPYPARWLSRPDGRALLRTVLSALVWMLVMIVVIGIPTAIVTIGALSMSLTTMGLGALLELLFIALIALPLVYPHMRYLTTRNTRLFSILGSGYRQGMRHWGYIFAVLLVLLLLTAIVLSITMLPAIVLLTANMKAQTGVIMGDPLGMPSYMGWLSLIVFILSGFIQAYVVLAIHFPAYYMAGSIEQQEIQRHETTENTLH